MKHLDKVLVDADVCINLARYTKKDALRLVLAGISDDVLINRYVYDVEILSSDAKCAMEALVADKIISVVDPALSLQGEVFRNYEEIALLFGNAFGVDPRKKRSPHKGEVVTVALAKVLGVKTLISNERALEREIKETINSGMDDLHVYRMKDIIIWLRNHPECGLGRKDSKIIWLLSFSSECLDEKKVEFDSIWPVNMP